ncbi:glycerol uptake facilitator protein [Mycoplasmoides fastidiosum]|uniref:Glycerol uptake facilitator protein n=1 Tax=Mycoplasmoides fastidiosum TaxID=92758 RepID=A0ABU0M079_9BACT|nr:MIP/aquaporin family protein [Mycoplasmoides fastidiosum]MDQ0514352.1 glycerol uptake facilitator protein [Mycoplasmoides fastidiosum]UUD38047.1 aquaporin family protein [Mycoplasmoides fastidiosum]
MHLDILSEFLGTMVLILLGNGVGFSVSHSRMFANQPGKWVVIAFAWGFAVMMGVIVSQALNGVAHLNPAVTLFAWISNPEFASGLGGALPVVYILAQFGGAMFGQMVLDFINWKHIVETDAAIVRSTHCTGPAFTNGGKDRAVVFNFAYELVGTLTLVGLILAFGRGNNSQSLSSLGPIPVTLLVVVIGMSIGSSTGYAINPARDLGPRIVYFFLEKFAYPIKQKPTIGANFQYGWLPVLAPALGGIIIGLFGLLPNVAAA